MQGRNLNQGVIMNVLVLWILQGSRMVNRVMLWVHGERVNNWLDTQLSQVLSTVNLLLPGSVVFDLHCTAPCGKQITSAIKWFISDWCAFEPFISLSMVHLLPEHGGPRDPYLMFIFFVFPRQPKAWTCYSSYTRYSKKHKWWHLTSFPVWLWVWVWFWVRSFCK